MIQFCLHQVGYTISQRTWYARRHTSVRHFMHAPYEVRFCLGLQKTYRSSSGETAKNSITSEVTGHVYNPFDVQAQQRRLICACKIHNSMWWYEASGIVCHTDVQAVHSFHILQTGFSAPFLYQPGGQICMPCLVKIRTPNPKNP